MNAAERRLELRGIFERQEFADLASLRERLKASESTLRRDLMALEKEGVLRRVHGGALAAPEREQAYDFAWQSACRRNASTVSSFRMRPSSLTRPSWPSAL